MTTSKQTKNHSKDPRRTSGHSRPEVSPEDSSPHLRIPAKEHLEYQHWYENETEKKGFSFRKLYNDFLENPSSSALSILVLVLVTIFAALAGFLAIQWMPVPKASYDFSLLQRNAYKRIPPDQVGYELVDAILLSLEKPTCFALDSADRLYIGGDSRISLFDSKGEKLASILLKANPTCLGISQPDCLFENHLLVGYQDAVEVCKILPNFQINPEPVFRWKLPGQTPYLRKVIAEKSSLVLADAGEKGVYRIDAEGNITLQIGFSQNDPSEEFSGFSIPALPFLDIVESPVEEIFFVTNPGKHRIEAFGKSGNWMPERGWGSVSVSHEGFCGCCNPSGLSCFPDGRFLTAEKYLSRVKVYDSSGRFQTVVATPEDLEKPPSLFRNVPVGTKLEYRSEHETSQPVQASITSDDCVAVLDPRYCSVRFYREKEKK